MRRPLLTLLFLFFSSLVSVGFTQEPKTDKVNVFLGSSGDHGQMSPAAGSPFGMLSIAPQTYPTTHTGYEHLAKETLGFTHNRMEGTGCNGSGGIILVAPYLVGAEEESLWKQQEKAGPGYYTAGYSNGISVSIAVVGKMGVHQYSFPEGADKGIKVDLSHAFGSGFVAEEHQVVGNEIRGWVDAKTTCNRGVYRTHYTLKIRGDVRWESEGSIVKGLIYAPQDSVELYVKVSSVDSQYTQITDEQGYVEMKEQAVENWEKPLAKIQVKGDSQREDLFYSLLYRTMQSPFEISEEDGAFRAIDGSPHKTAGKGYNGWAIWDNYKTQLPLLSLVQPERYQDIVSSILNLYPHGKKDFSTKNEPSNTVRTEHALVVLLDAHRKGYELDFQSVIDFLKAEVDGLSFGSPDQALESAYDHWALSEIYGIIGDETLKEEYRAKARSYRDYWNEHFKNMKARDVDAMGARGMYQGTIWQYRWAVPFDVYGLKELAGGEDDFISQLDFFFQGDYYNRANEPDLQSPLLYNATKQPWKSQYWVHRFAVDTVNNFYFNDNSRRVAAEVDRIFKNQPKAFIRTMDDDAGAMSAWYVLSAIGLHPALVGEPVYYLNAPLFEEVRITLPDNKELSIEVVDFDPEHVYIQKIYLNSEVLDRNWLTHKELSSGAELKVYTSERPNKDWGVRNQWVPNMDAEQ